MTKSSRSLLFLVLPLWVLAACGMDPESGSPVDTTLDLAGVASDCPAGDISQAISEIFPTKKNLRHVATVNCGQIFKDFGKGKQRQAIQKAFKFFEKTLEQNEKGQLLDPDPSVEAKVGELFTAIFAGIGFDLPEIDPTVLADGEYAFGELIPNGAPLITVSGHAGIDDGGGLFGPVSVFIVKIPPAGGEISLSSESHPCPAGVDDSFDCYPLFFDYSVFPESNVNPAVGLQLGQCNVSPSGVEVLLLSPEGFLPEDDAPTGVVCGDVEAEEVTMTGWRSYAWAVLEPISPLFRVTPAIAGKSPIGGRISAFSPVAPADPTSGGGTANGSIAFSSDRDGNHEVYVMNADGTGPTRLTNIAASDAFPAWSPDGTKIAFMSDRDGNHEIYVMNADGTGQTNLTDNAAGDFFPSWSPDGTKIAFNTTREGNQIFVMNADGTGQTLINFGDLPAWSPDGTKIAFWNNGVPCGVGLELGFEICVMNADGTGQTNLTVSAGHDVGAAWSPDGMKIAFFSDRDGNREIYVMNADGSGQTRLTNNVASDTFPAWSPDGTKIAFSSDRDGNGEIYVMNADGTGQIRLTNNSATDSNPSWGP